MALTPTQTLLLTAANYISIRKPDATLQLPVQALHTSATVEWDHVL
jgi:hypothetical protein